MQAFETKATMKRNLNKRICIAIVGMYAETNGNLQREKYPKSRTDKQIQSKSWEDFPQFHVKDRWSISAVLL